MPINRNVCKMTKERVCVFASVSLCVYVSSASHFCGRYNIILGKEIFSKEYEARPGCRFTTARFFSFDWELFHVALWTLLKCHKFQLWFLRFVKLYNLLKVTSNLSCHVLHCQEPQRWHGIYGKYQTWETMGSLKENVTFIMFFLPGFCIMWLTYLCIR